MMLRFHVFSTEHKITDLAQLPRAIHNFMHVYTWKHFKYCSWYFSESCHKEQLESGI
jgi:hypothetical protein